MLYGFRGLLSDSLVFLNPAHWFAHWGTSQRLAIFECQRTDFNKLFFATHLLHCCLEKHLNPKQRFGFRAWSHTSATEGVATTRTQNMSSVNLFFFLISKSETNKHWSWSSSTLLFVLMRSVPSFRKPADGGEHEGASPLSPGQQLSSVNEGSTAGAGGLWRKFNWCLLNESKVGLAGFKGCFSPWTLSWTSRTTRRFGTNGPWLKIDLPLYSQLLPVNNILRLFIEDVLFFLSQSLCCYGCTTVETVNIKDSNA